MKDRERLEGGSMIDLKTETERLQDGTCVVSIEGELDLYTAAGFEQALWVALSDGAAAVIVDLTNCDFLDSTALDILVSVNKRLGSSAGISIVTADRQIRKIFEITGLDRVFAIHPTRAAAMNSRARAKGWKDDDARTRTLSRRAVNDRIAQRARRLDDARGAAAG
jgi:anti-sigma B factor antagonist